MVHLKEHEKLYRRRYLTKCSSCYPGGWRTLIKYDCLWSNLISISKSARCVQLKPFPSKQPLNVQRWDLYHLKGLGELYKDPPWLFNFAFPIPLFTDHDHLQPPSACTRDDVTMNQNCEYVLWTCQKPGWIQPLQMVLYQMGLGTIGSICSPA